MIEHLRRNIKNIQVNFFIFIIKKVVKTINFFKCATDMYVYGCTVPIKTTINFRDMKEISDSYYSYNVSSMQIHINGVFKKLTQKRNEKNTSHITQIYLA